MNLYVIFSLARCGSTSLCRILNSVFNEHCILEPFASEYENGRLMKLAVTNGIGQSLREIESKFSGIKHVWHPLGWPFPSGSTLNDELILWPGVKVVLLHRKNILKRVVSHEMARQSGIWHADAFERIHNRSRFAFKNIDPEIVYSYLVNESTSLAKKRSLLERSGNAWISLDYESVFCSSPSKGVETIASMMSFLNLGRHLSEIEIGKKIEFYLKSVKEEGSELMYRRVPNIEEIEAAFGSPTTGRLFGDDV